MIGVPLPSSLRSAANPGAPPDEEDDEASSGEECMFHDINDDQVEDVYDAELSDEFEVPEHDLKPPLFRR